MKKILFIIALIMGIALFIMLLGFLLYSHFEVIDLSGKRVTTSENDEEIIIFDGEEEIFKYSILDWREQVKGDWKIFFPESIITDSGEVDEENFVWFSAVSAFPGISKIGFSTSTYGMPTDVSLFWLLDVTTKEIKLIGEENWGVVGNIVWSSNGDYFAYSLSSKEKNGNYLTIDNVKNLQKEVVFSKEEIITAVQGEWSSTLYFPEFRNLKWSEENENILFFTTNSLEEGAELKWSFDVENKSLKTE